MKNTSILLGVFALPLLITSGFVFFEYSIILSLQRKINQQNEVIVNRDTLITQLDNAINLAKSIMRLKSPRDSQYLTTFPNQNNDRDITKIFLINASISCNYNPTYPFETPWFNNSSRYFSSQREFELTDNRSIILSFWGWWFNKGGMAFGVSGGGAPTLNIGVMIRNDYTSIDVGAPLGNRTGNYFSSVNLGLRFYTENGNIIEIPKNTRVTAPTASSDTKMGGVTFLLGSGQTKQVIFYFPLLHQISKLLTTTKSTYLPCQHTEMQSL